MAKSRATIWLKFATYVHPLLEMNAGLTMLAQRRLLQVAGHPGSLKVLAGRGIVLAPGTKPTKVTYELLLGQAPDQVVGHGTLHARFSALERMWLQPDVTLRLENGQRICISITELKSIKASFEVVF